MTTTQTAKQQHANFLQFAVDNPVIDYSTMPDDLPAIKQPLPAEPDTPTYDVYQPLEQALKTKPLKPLSFLNADELAINAKAPDFLINDILETDTHGVIFGASQSFKSFDALAMAYSICTGKSFMNFKVFRIGKVIYICGEGKGALSRRLRALRLAESDFSGNLFVLNDSIAIDVSSDMGALKKAIEQYKPVLVIFDTFSSLAVNTNENDNTEVAQALRLIKDTCTNGVTSSILVAHTGKSKGAGERGASAFRANVDFSYELTRQPKSMVTTMSCIKNKDGEPFNDVLMKAVCVHLGITRQDGKEATSLVLKPCDDSDKPTQSNNKPLDGNNKAVFEQLPKALEKHGIDTPEHIKGLFPDDVKNIPDKVVSFESWRELANPYITTKTDSDSAKKSAFHRAKDWLEGAYYIGFSGNYAWIIKKS